MKMIKINYKKELFKGFSGLCESVFCAPFEDPNKFSEEEWENNRFSRLIDTGHKFLEYTSIEDCDFVVIPYKWDNRSSLTDSIIKEAQNFNKKILTLHNDDFEPLNIPSESEGYIYTTAINSNDRQTNCFPFPAFTGDFFDESYRYNLSRNFGFCGAITHEIRYKILSQVYNSQLISKKFIIRKGFWAPELSKNTARQEYVKNIQDSTFILCMRGAGNFSYRFYETLMMGRIPIIIDTNQVFPFENHINYDTFSFRIRESEIVNIELILKNISNIPDDKIKMMQDRSREFWLEYMSPEGWIKNFLKEL